MIKKAQKVIFKNRYNTAIFKMENQRGPTV